MRLAQVAAGERDEAVAAYLPPDTVLGQIEAAVVVTDQRSNLLYANAYAAKLFDFPDSPERLVGRSLVSLGFEEEDLGKAADLAKQVLRGRAWDGTFESVRPGGSRVFVRAQAVPLRHPSGAIDGIVIVGRQATRRSSQQERERIGLLERIGERLARSLELGLTLRHVAETLVPQFADHCFIDLYQGDKLFRRAQINADGWEPAPGTWAAVGEQIDYPDGHFCQQAMARLDPVLVSNLVDTEFPAPHAQSMRASEDVGLTSIVAAPLVARGELLGVISLALSRLTEREESHYDIDDRDFLGAVASRVAVAIDNALLFEEERRTALAFQTSLLPQVKPTLDGLDVAWRYVPAKPLETHGQGIQTQVGGDWYDLIPLSAGRVGIVIGDVEGRGARAAAIMGQLRATLRAFAQDDKAARGDPAQAGRLVPDAEHAAHGGRGAFRLAPGELHLPGLRRLVPQPFVCQRRPRRAAGGDRRRRRGTGHRASRRPAGRAWHGRGGPAHLPRGEPHAEAGDHPGALHRRAHRPPAARRWQRPLHRGGGPADAVRGRAGRGRRIGRGHRPGRGAGRARRHRRRHGHRRGQHLARGSGLVAGHVPGRGDPGLRGAPPRTAHLRALGPATGPG